MKEAIPVEMKTVQAEISISYVCNCPYCKETIYSEYQDDWDVSENVHYDMKIKCTECDGLFMVSIPA